MTIAIKRGLVEIVIIFNQLEKILKYVSFTQLKIL